MTYAEVIHYMADQLQIPQTEVRKLYGVFIRTFKTYLDQEKDVYLPGLGTFHTAHRKERKGFHPVKQQKMMLPKRRVLTLHASSTIRDEFKNGRGTA